MFAFNSAAVIESVPGAFPFFNLCIACLTSPKVGSLTEISSVMSLSSDSHTLSLIVPMKRNEKVA